MVIAKELEGSRVTDSPHHVVRGIPSNVTIDVGLDDDPAWHTTCMLKDRAHLPTGARAGVGTHPFACSALRITLNALQPLV